MPDEQSLLPAGRQRMILSILEREGMVRTAELSELFRVSMVTIRSDLRELETAGECQLIWGGAISKRPATERELQLDRRSQLHAERKKRIGERAAQFVEIGQTIIVDAGTTTVELIHSLSREIDYLRIVTPALNIAAAAAYFPNFECVMTGGVLRNLTHSLIGPQVVRALEMFNADWTFLASGGFSLEQGVTTSNILEVEVKRVMVQRGTKVVLLADSSKFGRILSLNVAPLSDIDILITDAELAASDVQAIADIGVQVLQT